jgi:hypothetical protein
MRKSCRFAVVLAAALGLAGTAQGAILTSASIFIPFGRFGVPPPITGTGAGTSLGVGATATLASSTLTGVATGTVTAAPPISQVILSLTGHAAGSFTPSGGPGGGFGGTMTLAGAVRIMAYGGEVSLVRLPLSPAGQPGGFFHVTTPGEQIILQVSGTGWTTGSWTLMVPATTIDGGTQTPYTVTATGADLRTAGGADTLVLITPMFIRTNYGGDVPTFATLTLNYVPEPSTLLLVGVGIAGLALRGRKRHQPSQEENRCANHSN